MNKKFIAGSMLPLVFLLGGCGASELGQDANGLVSKSRISTLNISIDYGDGIIDERSVLCQEGNSSIPSVEGGVVNSGSSEQCQQLFTVDKEIFSPVGSDQACTEQYGGPQTATITGTLAGEKIDAEFSRTNGCEIARWDSLNLTLPVIE